MNADKRRLEVIESDSQHICVDPRSSAVNTSSAVPERSSAADAVSSPNLVSCREPFNPALVKVPLIPSEPDVRLNVISEQIIGCVFRVSNTLGCGFLEKVYENALTHELRKSGLNARQQEPVKVLYDGIVVGDYFADILVEGAVILELKAVKEFDDIHIAQCLNYLKATGLKLCLLINFGKPKTEIKRFVNKF